MQDAKAGAPLDCFSMLTRVTHRNSSITNKSCHSKTGNSVRRRHASPFTVRDIGVHMGAEFDDYAQLCVQSKRWTQPCIKGGFKPDKSACTSSTWKVSSQERLIDADNSFINEMEIL